LFFSEPLFFCVLQCVGCLFGFCDVCIVIGVCLTFVVKFGYIPDYIFFIVRIFFCWFCFWCSFIDIFLLELFAQ